MGQAPWWFAAAMSILGVLLGISLKWATDRATETRRLRREDSLRFLNERREIYAQFAQANYKVADAKDTYHLLGRELKSFENLIKETTHRLEVADPESETYRNLLNEATALNNRRVELHQELADGAKLVVHQLGEFTTQRLILELVAPKRVRDAANQVSTDNQDGGGNGTLRAFLEVARQDLTSKLDITSTHPSS